MIWKYPIDAIFDASSYFMATFMSNCPQILSAHITNIHNTLPILYLLSPFIPSVFIPIPNEDIREQIAPKYTGGMLYSKCLLLSCLVTTYTTDANNAAINGSKKYILL